MYFNHPLFLLLLVFPLTLLLYSFRSKKQTLTSVFSPEVLKKISINSNLIQSNLKYRLLISVTILLTIALAQPILKHTTHSLNQKSIPLVIALDISKSMLKDDLYPNRLSLALSKIETIMNSNSKLRVGLLLFAKGAYVAHPLSEDKSSLKFIARSINYSEIMESSTDLFAALEGATQMLQKYKSKNLLILSDIKDIRSFKEESLYIQESKLNVTLLQFTKESPSLTYSSDDIDTILKKLHKTTQKENEQSTQDKNRLQLFYFPLLLAFFILLFIYAYGLEMKSKSIHIFVCMLLVSSSTQTEASLLDFHHISKATTHYKDGEYRESIKSYMKIIGEDDVSNAKIYYNIANAYVRLGELHLAKKYYEKSLAISKDTDAQENLAQVKRILSNQKHKNAKKEEKYKLPQRISIHKQATQETMSSDYVVKLNAIVLSEEDKILKELKKQKPIIFLRQLHIQRRSKNVLQD